MPDTRSAPADEQASATLKEPAAQKLTFKEQSFVNYYLGECKGNGTQAAQKAGYKHPRNDAYEVKHRPHVAAAIERALEDAAMSRDEVLMRLADQARADLARLGTFSSNGFRLDLDKAEFPSHLIKSIKHGEFGTEFVLVDSQAALVTLGKYHKLFTERHEHDFTKLSDDDLIARAKSVLLGDGTARAADDAP